MPVTERACFSPYMMITSVTQSIFGAMRRKEMDESHESNRKFALEMQIMKEQLQGEQEDKKYSELRAKMLLARKYRAEEKVEVDMLNELKKEFEAFVTEYLPIETANFSVIIDIAKQYRSKGYNSECPLNILLLKTESRMLDYSRIWDKLENAASGIGNVQFRRWCNRDIAGNCAILNLHTAMSAIPTVVISPFILGNRIHFSAAMWEAQVENSPMIRPLFSIPFDRELLKTANGKKQVENKIALVSTIVAGCARDSYMLLSQGVTPTLPKYLETHSDALSELKNDDYRDLISFISDEYKTTVEQLSAGSRQNKILTEEEMRLLSGIACNALDDISRLNLDK